MLFLNALKSEVAKVSRAYDQETRIVSAKIDALSRIPLKATFNGTAEAKNMLEKLERLALLNREAVRKIIKKFQKKTKTELPMMAIDLSLYSFGSDSEIIILEQRLEAYHERALELTVGEGKITQLCRVKGLNTPSKFHVLIEITRMRKLLLAALADSPPKEQWQSRGTAVRLTEAHVDNRKELEAGSTFLGHLSDDHKNEVTARKGNVSLSRNVQRPKQELRKRRYSEALPLNEIYLNKRMSKKRREGENVLINREIAPANGTEVKMGDMDVPRLEVIGSDEEDASSSSQENRQTDDLTVTKQIEDETDKLIGSFFNISA